MEPNQHCQDFGLYLIFKSKNFQRAFISPVRERQKDRCGVGPSSVEVHFVSSWSTHMRVRSTHMRVWLMHMWIYTTYRLRKCNILNSCWKKKKKCSHGLCMDHRGTQLSQFCLIQIYHLQQHGTWPLHKIMHKPPPGVLDFSSFSLSTSTEFWCVWIRGQKDWTQVAYYFFLIWSWGLQLPGLLVGVICRFASHTPKMCFLLCLQASFFWLIVPLFYWNAVVLRGHYLGVWASTPVSRNCAIKSWGWREVQILYLTCYQTGCLQQTGVVFLLTKPEK